jgi:TolA-binding protein
MFRRLLVLVLVVSPTLFGADKTTETLLALLRDVGTLQDQVKALQKSLDDRLAGLNQSEAEQARATADQVAKSLAAVTAGVQKTLQSQQEQQSKTTDSVAAVGSQVQSVSDQLNTMRQALNDLTAAVSRLSTKLDDVSTAVAALQAPKPDAGKGQQAQPQPQVSATDLFANAEGDFLGGKLELALQEYSDYVSKFANTPQAADAQYYVGSIHYSNQEWDPAVQAFNALLQTYPDSKRVPESLYYKANSLARLGHASDANDTLKELRRRFPDNPLAKRELTAK